MKPRKSFTDEGVQFAPDSYKHEQAKALELFEKATQTGDCLICHRKPNPKGYCYITLGRERRERAHRFIFEVINGKISSDAVVMHTCDTRNCINPKHLKAGTVADNQRDMMVKGRAKNKPKEPNTEENIRAFELFKSGYTMQEIGMMTGVGTSTAHYRVQKGRELQHET
jgi:hypothetical protein